MEKETLKALKGSIAKWRRIVDRNGPDKGGQNCPLCNVLSCGYCPVAQKAKRSCCGGTPYIEWCRRIEVINPIAFDAEVLRHNGDPTARKIAKAELKFLESLLPKAGQ